MTTKYNVISEASLQSSPKNETISFTVPYIYAITQQIYVQFCLTYKLMFFLLSSDTL